MAAGEVTGERAVLLLNPWLALTFRAFQLGLEAQNVIALRMLRLAAGGPRAQNEVRRMTTEKIAAAIETQATAASGIITGRKNTAVAATVIRGLRKRVRANQRRLSRR
jgi:hypothetical protein